MRVYELLSELTGIKNLTSRIGKVDPWDAHDADPWEEPEVSNQSVHYRDILIGQGFREVGYGAHGTVWLHDRRPNEVLKVFMSSDQAYVNWFNICRSHVKSPNLPKFFSARPRRLTNDFLAVRMEVLKPSSSIDHLGQQIGNLVYNCAHGNRVQGPLQPVGNVQELKDYLESAGPDHNGYPRFNLIQDYLKQDPGFLQALWILTQALRNKQGSLDLQGANMMMRGSTLVLADPLA